MAEKHSPTAAAKPLNIGEQLYNIHDVQALIEAAMALAEGGDPIRRILSMANGRLDEIGEALDQSELDRAGASR